MTEPRSSASVAGIEMPFLDHLEELRARLLWSLLALIIGFGIAMILVLRFDVIGILQMPIREHLNGQKLVYTHPGETFNIVMSVAFALGAVIAVPVILYQIWAFLSPALYAHEKRVMIPVLAGATILFLAGVALAWFLILPFTLSFLLGFQSGSLTPMITAQNYFGFVTGMCLALGAVFELPILIVALTALGLVTPQLLIKFRKHAFVACFVVAAVITPGDVLTATIVLLGPLYGLYELSIGLSFFMFRRRVRRQAEAARLEAAGASA